MPPEVRLRTLLTYARRRVLLITTGWAIGAGSLVAAPWLLWRVTRGASTAELLLSAALMVTAAVATAILVASRQSGDAIVESRTLEFRNTLVTSAAILRGDLTPKPAIRDLVLSDTAARAERFDLRALLPARMPTAAAVAGLLVLSVVIAFGGTRPRIGEGARPGEMTMSDGPMSIRGIEIQITPPPYSGRGAERLENPARIEALEGSRLAFRVATNNQVEHVLLDEGGSAQTPRDPLALRFAGNHSFTGEIVARDQTFVNLTLANLNPGPRLLIPMTVVPDAAPLVRVAEPGRDLFLADGARDIPIRVAATDDIGVTSLTLAWTRVSGSGETFQFVEGTLPLALAGAGTREMHGTASLRPSAMGLAAGDMLVYRAIARDAHPTRAPVESDAFVVEIVGASEAMAEGFSIDDQRDRYAISQQMVILKTERLIAARRSMGAALVAEEAARIAAEQRQVRAEFVFMMGGEIEDEEVEAEQSHELAEGREQNEGRRDLIGAIRAMSDAAALLMRPELDQALAVEKRALTLLQRALTRSRYILRVLATRERIDDARRLSGDRTGATGWRRASGAAALDPARDTLQAAAQALSAMARRAQYSADDRRAIADIATTLLTLGSDGEVRDAAQGLSDAARANDARVVAQHLDRAALAIDARLESLSRGGAAPRSPVPHRVRSALAERLRAGGRGGR